MLSIGPFSHDSRVIVAPMAGVTDLPFRDLCREYGAFWTISEMVTSNAQLWHTTKSRLRLAHRDEAGVRWVQLAGSDPLEMARAARANVALGAEIIDINMGCPAKKVCNRAAGSALLRDEKLVDDILQAVVAAVPVPVTLKTRLGWSRDEINACRIARIAEAAGISLITIHGRTRACRFSGEVDYDAIARVKQSVTIPVIANGDISSPAEARSVLSATGCDGVMIGRAAQGRPWLIGDIDRALRGEPVSGTRSAEEVAGMLQRHLKALHRHYGERQGIRIARKHVGWALDALDGARDLKARFNRVESVASQFRLIDQIGACGMAALVP